jgi:hypothetical protein
MTNKHQRRQAIRAMRGKMRSPGRPSTARREDRVRFWEAIGGGVSSEDAAAEAGVASAVGTSRPPPPRGRRWWCGSTVGGTGRSAPSGA